MINLGAGTDTVVLGGTGETVNGGGGNDTLNEFSGFGDVFSGTFAHLNTTTIGNFGGSDLIALTDMNSSTMLNATSASSRSS